jgi:hypothetical protein
MTYVIDTNIITAFLKGNEKVKKIGTKIQIRRQKDFYKRDKLL